MSHVGCRVPHLLLPQCVGKSWMGGGVHATVAPEPCLFISKMRISCSAFLRVIQGCECHKVLGTLFPSLAGSLRDWKPSYFLCSFLFPCTCYVICIFPILIISLMHTYCKSLEKSENNKEKSRSYFILPLCPSFLVEIEF